MQPVILELFISQRGMGSKEGTCFCNPGVVTGGTASPGLVDAAVGGARDAGLHGMGGESCWYKIGRGIKEPKTETKT